MTNKDQIKSSVELKQFGHTMALMCFIFLHISLWKHDLVFSNTAIALFIVGGLFSIFGCLAPLKLSLVEKYWLKFGEKINSIVTPVILTLTFFIVITPLGLFMRLLGKDLMQLKIDRASKSYWTKVEQGGPSSRPYAPY